jgi:hypothetical protein
MSYRSLEEESMKLRIRVADPKKDKAGDRSLKTLYRSGRLLVEGTADIRTVELDDGRQVFFAGQLVGVKNGRGELTVPAGLSEALKSLLGAYPPEVCRERMEGRFLVVVAGPGAQCRIFTDPFGQRDLYYRHDDKQPCFASDLSLLPGRAARDGYDPAAMAHTLCVYGLRPPKRHTLYRGVRRLGIGETVEINGREIRITESPFKPVRTASFTEREHDEYADLFLEAMKARGSRHGNVVYLSSGWDSTAILAALVHLFGSRRVRCVIACMKYSERSGVINPFEMKRAQAVADYYGIPLEVVDFDYRDKRIIEHVERWRPVLKSHQLASGAAVNLTVLAEYVRRTATGGEAVFSGEISDGVHNLGFSQFITMFHPVLEFREYADKMASYLFGPSFLTLFQSGKHQEDPIYSLFRQRAGGTLFDEPADSATGRSRQLFASFFLRPNRLPLWSLRNCEMLTDKGVRLYSREMESAYLGTAARQVTPETLYAWHIHLYNSFHWQGSTIAPLGVTAEALGFDMHLPYWDSGLHEFLSAMPENWGRGLDLNPTKYPLKRMLQNRIDYPMHLQVGPHSYLYDVEPTFSHGAEMVYGSGFAPHFKQGLRSGAWRDLLSKDVFNLPYIEGIVKRYLGGTEVRGAELRDLIPLCWLSLVGWYGN